MGYVMAYLFGGLPVALVLGFFLVGLIQNTLSDKKKPPEK